MKAQVYRVVRDLHLYLGLFISPFVLVFAVSVFFIVHAWFPKVSTKPERARVVTGLILPEEISRLSGRPLIDALKPTLEKMNVRGEVGFIKHMVKEETFIIPVMIPGRSTTVTINLPKNEATVVTRETGLAEELVALHKSPGQHGPDIRMNWFFMRAWRWLADATVYLILFITVSGIYLWYVLKAERRIGFILLFTGAATFFGITYVISR